MISEVPYPNVVQFSFPNRRELTLTMCRPQEFYESSHADIRGRYFDWEKFLEVFSEDDGRLQYFSFWSGFNFPGKVFESFLKAFDGNLSSRERRLAKEIFAKVDRASPYYVIATLPNASDTVRHELAHALFCVNDGYRRAASELVSLVPPEMRDRMSSGLEKMGYSKDVHVDEIQAYFATSTPEFLKERFGLRVSETPPLAGRFESLLRGYLP